MEDLREHPRVVIPGQDDAVVSVAVFTQLECCLSQDSRQFRQPRRRMQERSSPESLLPNP